MKIWNSLTLVLGLAFLSLCPMAAKAGNLTWNLSFTGDDCCGDVITIDATLTTGPLSAGSYQITGITGSWGLNYFGVIYSDTITGLQTSYITPDNLLLPNAPYLDSNGLGFTIGPDTFDDGMGDVTLESAPTLQDANLVCEYPEDLSPFCGDLSVTQNTPQVSGAPEPATLGLLGLGLIAVPAMGKLRKRK